MNKVKVWGKEIEDCIYCNYCSSYEPRCIIGKFNLYDGYELGYREDIHKDCPFSKPITKEVVESYGFEYLDCKSNLLMFRKRLNNGDIYNLWLGDKINNYVTIIFKDPSEQLRFKGVINNPVELEFIFKSMGIIE